LWYVLSHLLHKNKEVYMCGIVGYIGHREAVPILLQGLKQLEYRGYDSAGVAVIDIKIKVRRSVGKLTNLDQLLHESPVHGVIGIGHTRWATHGRPSEANAHPHCAGTIAVVHNGIIENYLELRRFLQEKGRKFTSETDTEVVAHLIDEHVEKGDTFVVAVQKAIKMFVGSFSIVVLCEDEPDKVVVAKNATPMVIGYGEGENFVASDVSAFLDHTRKVSFLDDGEMAEITRENVKITDFSGKTIERTPREITWDVLTAQKGGYKHFLLKEIHEQPHAIGDTARGRIILEEGKVLFEELEPFKQQLVTAERVTLVACGTALHACLVAKFFLEQIARIPVEVDYASEYRYRESPVSRNTLLIAVSQSGETADTLEALRQGKTKGAATLAVCNVVDSSIPREADSAIYTHAGPEISVASTKAFTTQLVILYLLAIYLAQQRNRIDAGTIKHLCNDLLELPGKMKEFLASEKTIEKIAKKYGGANDMLFLGRGVSYPIALEGALKVKEISYIHAEGYPAGEMKHGPIALVDEDMPVVALLPAGMLFLKSLSNMKEVETRGGRIIIVTDAPTSELEDIAWEVIKVPTTNCFLIPLLLTIPLQLLAYFAAVHRCTDVDQPRNLAKSVTVE
jgi:glutamine---fructose-6-phosphate transaminase (isomerizing)